MEFITGLLAGVCLLLAYIVYKKPKQSEVKQVDEREKEREKELNEHFDALMNYDVATAYKKVNNGR
jgi:predicted histidine transporter YuiF (NhaC family)